MVSNGWLPNGKIASFVGIQRKAAFHITIPGCAKDKLCVVRLRAMKIILTSSACSKIFPSNRSHRLFTKGAGTIEALERSCGMLLKAGKNKDEQSLMLTLNEYCARIDIAF